MVMASRLLYCGLTSWLIGLVYKFAGIFLLVSHHIHSFSVTEVCDIHLEHLCVVGLFNHCRGPLLSLVLTSVPRR